MAYDKYIKQIDKYIYIKLDRRGSCSSSWTTASKSDAFLLVRFLHVSVMDNTVIIRIGPKVIGD